jgi:hypothetical protein
MVATAERFGESGELNSASSQVERHPAAAYPTLTQKYVSPTEFARRSEALEGEIRGWKLIRLGFKRDEERHKAAQAKVKAETARLGYIAEGLTMLTAQQTVLQSQNKLSTARLRTEESRVDVAVARLDLKSAIATYPLHHAQLKARLEGMAIDVTESLQKNQTKREPLNLAGAFNTFKAPTYMFPTRAEKPDVQEL